MNQLPRCLGLFFLACALAVPTYTAAQDKKADDTKKDAKADQQKKDDTKKDAKADETKTDDAKKSTADTTKAKAKGKLKPDWGTVLSGKLTALDDKDEAAITFTLKVGVKVPDLDAQKQLVQQNQQLLQQQINLQKQTKPQDMLNVRNQIAQTTIEILKTQARLLKDASFDVKCNALEKMRVRYFQPQQPIDVDTGEFIKLTDEQVKEARGTEGYPGYKAEPKLLKIGQTVMVYLSKDTKTPDSLLDKKNKNAPKKIDDLQDEINNFRYDVIMVYVAVDAPKEKKN